MSVADAAPGHTKGNAVEPFTPELKPGDYVWRPAVLLPTGYWEKASTGVASSTFASNQNLQTSGVTNVVSSQAMTAIPLPMER